MAALAADASEGGDGGIGEKPRATGPSDQASEGAKQEQSTPGRKTGVKGQTHSGVQHNHPRPEPDVSGGSQEDGERHLVFVSEN